MSAESVLRYEEATYSAYLANTQGVGVVHAKDAKLARMDRFGQLVTQLTSMFEDYCYQRGLPVVYEVVGKAMKIGRLKAMGKYVSAWDDTVLTAYADFVRRASDWFAEQWRKVKGETR